MKPTVLAAAVAIACYAPAASLRAEDEALVRARALLERVPLVDGHNDLPWTLRETASGDLSKLDLRKRGATVDTDIPRLREGRVSGQFWSVFIPSGLPHPARTQLEQIELARRIIDAYPDTFVFATRAEDVERARAQGKIASFLAWRTGKRSRTASARSAPTTPSASAT
jgi:membrane dipeptidase